MEEHADPEAVVRRLIEEGPASPDRRSHPDAGRVAGASLHPEITLTPTVAADGRSLRAMHSTPEVARWWDLPKPGFPMHDEPETTRLTIRFEGEIAGLIQYGEETEPKYRAANLDIFVGPAFHRRGIGTAAIRVVVDLLIGERGHHRLTIDPAADNHAAIRTYEKAGFAPVGVMRQAERDSDGDGWHDTLLMELVVEPDIRTTRFEKSRPRGVGRRR